MKDVTGRVLLVLAALLVLMFVGVLTTLLDWLRPDRAAPELASRRSTPAPARVLHRNTAPASPDDQCSVRVVVVDAQTQPIADAEVSLAVHPDRGSIVVEDHWADEQWTDAQGVASWDHAACGMALVRATFDDLAPANGTLTVQPGVTAVELVLMLNAGVRLHGVVEDLDGDPIPDAVISSDGEQATSDHRGRYEMVVSAGRISLSVDAFGYRADWMEVPDEAMDDEHRDAEQDIVLEPHHEVRVWCAGLPDDECGDVLIQCTHPLVPVGEQCPRGLGPNGNELVCDCPDGDVAIRGGGRSVRVDADETEAWLDFRDAGTMTGRILLDGDPSPFCNVALLRVPHGLEDVPNGLIAARRSSCAEDGTFEVAGLVEGDWELIVDVNAEEGSLQRTTVPTRVRPRRTTDVGDIEMRGGGGIEGVLIDGLTGEPVSHEPVLAMRVAAQGERTTPQGSDTNTDGEFSFNGLPPGKWRLAHPLRPHEYSVVNVEDGVITDGIEVWTSDATSLDLNGFSLASDGDELIVGDVEPGSPADDAGLWAGDQVAGIQLAGFDLTGMAGGDPRLARAVLGHWDGPGVTLVVERDGEQIEVPLEW